MVITVSMVEGDGSILTRTVDTAEIPDPGRWTQLAEDAALHMPPRYRPRPGETVYRIQAGGLTALVAERDLQGPLRDLTEALFAEAGS
jgi:hypothetical protein